MAAVMQEAGSDDDEMSCSEEESEQDTDTESETEPVIATMSRKKDQRQTVTKLYDLALRAAQINLWQKSKLPSLVVELAYKKEHMAKLNRIFTDAQEDEYFKKMQSSLRIIEETLMNLEYLPFRLKVKLLAAIAGLNKDIKFVISEIAKGFEKCLKKYVKYCITKIILTENGSVDLTKTILNIIKETQFKIEFRPLFLAHYCIKKSDVKTIYQVVLKEMNKAFALKKRNIKKNLKQKIYFENFSKLYNSWIDGVEYWERERRMSRFDLDDARFQIISFLQYVAVRGHEDVLKFHFRKFKCSPKYAYEKQEVVMEMAKFALSIGCFSEEKIMFFYRNLKSDLWNELLKKYFKEIFLSLLESWHYRDLCPKFFKEMIVYQDTENIKEIFTCVADLCYRERFEYYDIISVIQNVWFQTPTDVKEDKNICLVVIPRLILLKADFESLIHFLGSYSVEIQKEIVGQVVFGLLTSGREGLVQKCLKTAKQLDLEINDCKEVIDYESLKRFLLIDAQFTELSYSHLASLTNLLCASKFEELKLKKELLSETAFIVDLLSSISAKEDFDNILLWGLNNERNVEMFKKKLFNEELINEVYDRRLIENDDLETADKVFKLLGYSSEEILMIKKRVHENPLVVRLLLTKLLNETDQLERTDEYLTWLFENQEQRQLFMEEFLFSDDGKNAIFDALLTLENLETFPTLRFSGAKVMLKCWDLKEYWLKPFGLVAKMDAMLGNNMRQFMSHRIVFKDKSHCYLNTREKNLAVRYARDIFTGFREIVKKNFSKLDIEFLEHMSLVNIAEYLVREDGPQFI